MSNKSKDVIRTEALEAIGDKKHAGIAVTMRGGKCRIGLTHADKHYSDKLRFLVVAPRVSIFESWKDEAVKANLSHLLPHVEFTTYLSLPDKDLDYDIIYLDECHSLLFSHEEWLDQFQGKIIGLTGTPPKHKNSEKGLMVAKYCPIVYEYLLEEAVTDGILNDYRVLVHLIKLDSAKTLPVTVKKTGATWMSSEVEVYNYWSKRVDLSSGKAKTWASVMRMKALQGFPSKERLAKAVLAEVSDKCLLFANTQEQADKLCSHSYHSKNPKSEENLKALKDGTVDLMSCVLQISEGITIKGLKEVVIMHAYGNERKLMQRMGRAMGLEADDLATIHVLCYKDTVDRKWVGDSLSDLDPSKITWLDY